MAQKQILIVEDDEHISKLVRYNLEKAGFSCRVSASGEDALESLDKEPVDLIILDIMLPDMDGFEVARQIKQDETLSFIPIIILTAKGEEVDRVVGLELGADDYIVKPFSPRELVLRVKAILKRNRPAAATDDILRAGNLTLNVPKHKLTVNKRDIELTLLEFKLLVTFMQRRGRVQSRERLLTDVWDINVDMDITTRTIDTHVKRLRQKLGRAGELIETVRGIGYRFREGD